MNIYEFFLSSVYRILRGDKRYKYYRKLKSNLKLSRKEIVLEQNKNIRKLIDHAYYNTQYYKELMDSLKIHPNEIRTKDDLKKLPELTKKIIRNNFEKITSNDKYAKSLFKETSGGSTGEMAILYKSAFFNQMSRGSWLRNNAMIGWMPFDKSAWIWGSPIGSEKSFITNGMTLLNRRILLDAFEFTNDDFPVWYQKILNYKPKVIYGYSGIILKFSIYLIENKLVLPSVKIVVSTSEKLKNHEIIEKAFNCKVHDQYGCREVIAVGIELGTGGMIFTDDIVVVNTNSSHHLLLTPLFSYGFPLINYKVGDIGEIKNTEEINSHYPFPKMDLQIGRMSDYFLKENNNRISTVAFSEKLDACNFKIEEHQIIQKNYKEFEINFVPEENTDLEKYYKDVTLCLESFFGKDLEIKFIGVLNIPIEKSGKLLLYKRTFQLSM